ncbi:hypothetical protein AN958_03283 [Leucoagaricus sp. SymC.cos]|nr:hypothetical protein AN958_03283 [Leucoagaricus sp. SymC.cos]
MADAISSGSSTPSTNPSSFSPSPSSQGSSTPYASTQLSSSPRNEDPVYKGFRSHIPSGIRSPSFSKALALPLIVTKEFSDGIDWSQREPKSMQHMPVEQKEALRESLRRNLLRQPPNHLSIQNLDMFEKITAQQF